MPKPITGVLYAVAWAKITLRTRPRLSICLYVTLFAVVPDLHNRVEVTVSSGGTQHTSPRITVPTEILNLHWGGGDIRIPSGYSTCISKVIVSAGLLNSHDQRWHSRKKYLRRNSEVALDRINATTTYGMCCEETFGM